MKSIKCLLGFMAAMLLAGSCVDSKPEIEYLEVTPNNISGDWKLEQWNGSLLKEPTYFYMTIERKDRKFTFYQNFYSMGKDAHISTGRYNITAGTGDEKVIIGEYDYSAGFWAHEFVVSDLTPTNMTWVAVDDPTYVQKFVRISDIPEDVRDAEK